MATGEVTFTVVNHNGVEYPVDTPVSKIDDLSKDQLDRLRAAGAVGKPVVPSSVENELEAKTKEVEELKAKIAQLETAKATAEKAG